MSQSPRDRARERLRWLSEQALAVAAGIAVGASADAQPYGVVDPMPPPARDCTEFPPDSLAGQLYPSAYWVYDGTDLVVQFTISLGYQVGGGATFDGGARVVGGSMHPKGPMTKTTNITIEVKPAANVKEIDVEVPIKCPPNRKETGRWRIDLTSAAKSNYSYLTVSPLAAPTPTPDPTPPDPTPPDPVVPPSDPTTIPEVPKNP